MTKLKIGNKVIENDGISVIVYEIKEIKGDKAIGEAEYEGKVYPTAYKVEYEGPNDIQTYYPRITDNRYTEKRLAPESK